MGAVDRTPKRRHDTDVNPLARVEPGLTGRLQERIKETERERMQDTSDICGFQFCF